MQVTLRKYVDANHDVQEDVDPSTDEAHKMPQLKVHNLQKKISLLEKKQRNMMGEDIDSLSTKQLDRLEKQLQIAASRIYHRKIILLSHVSKLLTEEIKLMQEENRKLKTEVGNKGETSYSFTMPLIDALHVPPQASENDDSQVEADADLHLRLV